ncbi:MAG TPA: hypothetical protein VMR50_18965 [Myxococcota bacterium]|nr:hypothetical protein [Myxococcota bacterium]
MSGRARAGGLLALFALGAAAPARADDAAPASHYDIGLYIWGTSVSTHVETSDGDVSEHISFSELLKHLNGGLQGHARGEWGNWSLDLDGSYARLSGDNVSKVIRLGPRGGVQIGAEVKSQLDEWIVEANAGYRLLTLGSPFSSRPSDTRKFRAELYGGLRYWSVDPKIQVHVASPGSALKVRLGDREQWLDPTVGLRFATDLSSTVVFRVSGDVGGFNIGNYCSDFTWSQITALSWGFSESWTAHVGYKFLDFHRDSGSTNERVQTRGPFIALSYGF